MKNQEEKYPKGHFVGLWTGLGIALFSGLGIPISIVTGNQGLIGIGPALGVAIGVAIGQSIENKYEKEGKIRPLTEKEKQGRKRVVYIMGALLVLGVLALFLFILYMK